MNPENETSRGRGDHPESGAIPSFSARVVREMRGALDEEQERWLTIAQSERLHQGEQLRLIDPETGAEYVLVPAADYDHLKR